MKPVKRNAQLLALDDLVGQTEAQIKEHLISIYQASPEEVNRFKVLIASEREESYDGSSSFLLEEKKTGFLFENHASHCSCYGYEGQFAPESTTAEYLLSNNCGLFNGVQGKDWIKKNIRLTKSVKAV